MKKRFSPGYILIAVLVCMQIFSLLSLYGLTLTVSNIKRNRHAWQYYLYQFKSQVVLQQIESRVLTGSIACSIPIFPATALAQKPLTWWQLNACSDNANGIRYYYVLELLGNDPCGIIDKQSQVHANYYRITLFLQPDTLSGVHYMWQSTLALPSVQTMACQGELHPVKLGRQMWREI